MNQLRESVRELLTNKLPDAKANELSRLFTCAHQAIPPTS